MKEKSKSEVSIIGGADGPTSIFIAGRTRKRPLKVMKGIHKPDISNEESVKEYFCKIETRSEMIAEMPDDVMVLSS